MNYTQQELYQYLNTICNVVLCVFEQHDNRPHIHMLFNEAKISKSRVIQKMIETFPLLKGNGSYSCSATDKMKKKGVGDDEKAKCYLCKGASESELPIVVGVAHVDVKFYHNKYWETFLKAKSNGKSEVNMGCQNDSSLVSKAKSKTWSEKVFDDIVLKYQSQCMCINNFQLLYKPTDYEREMYDLARNEIFRYMMKCLGKAVKKLSDRIIEEIWNGIINAIIQNTGSEEESNAYSDKLFIRLIK